MECLDLNMFKIVNAQPSTRYIPLDRPKAQVQEIINQLLDLGCWNNAHFGETIHVVGCGPSARNFAPLAAGRISIGVNGAGVVIPELTYWLACDPISTDRPLNNAIRKYLMENTYYQHAFQFILSWQRNPMQEAIGKWTLFKQSGEFLRRQDKPHWRNGFYFYHSSVHAAMELARLMGAKKIVLWGVDYDDRSHCYTGKEIVGDCKDNPDKEWDDIGCHLEGFLKIKEFYEKEGIEIENANLNSKIGIFKKVDYQPTEKDLKPWTITWRMFATRNSPYDEMARQNAWKFSEHQVGVRVDLFDKTDSWMKNCMQRPAMLLKVLNTQKTAVGLLDADVEPVQDPVLFRETQQNWDVMCVYRGSHKLLWDRYCAGYVAFAYTPMGRRTLERWVELCETDPEPDAFCREQKYLGMAIEEVQPRLFELPSTYDFVPPKKWDNKYPEDTVLIHLPASRKHLKEMGGTRGTKKED